MDADVQELIDFEVVIRLLISFCIGTAIGIEREYHSKAAGLRTMIMICLGSTVFTEISISIGEQSPDRIASNIITGIGFLGAGVIFKDGLTISGITTATTIWICAALGMAVGAGEYFIALTGSVIVLVVLVALQNVTRWIERFNQARTYTITYRGNEPFLSEIERQMTSLDLIFKRRKDFKYEGLFIVNYEISGKEIKLDSLNAFLKEHSAVQKYEY
jgi:putative Mg2+ transporter-C (MgtC) family protein